MPADAALTDHSWKLINTMPSWARDDPGLRAVQHCFAQESDRMIAKAREVRAGLVPQTATSLLLGAWERLLKTTEGPPGTDDARRTTIKGLLLQLLAEPSGLRWEDSVTAIIGLGYTYEEQTPDPYTIRMVVPYAPGTEGFLRIERLVREFTPANTDLVISSGQGFVLDQSQLDQEPFHPS